MRLTWLPIVLPVVAGAVAAWLLPASEWINLSAGLLPALSVVGAAALVRLSRAFPVGNADQFTVDEAGRVTAALEALARALRMLIRIVLVTMIALVVLPRLLGVFSVGTFAVAAEYAGYAVSAFLATAVVFVLVRLLQIVNSDVSLVDLQAKMFRESARRSSEKAFEDGASAARGARSDYKTPEGFGAVFKVK